MGAKEDATIYLSGSLSEEGFNTQNTQLAESCESSTKKETAKTLTEKGVDA